MWYLRACRACLTTEGKLERMDAKTRRTFSCLTELAMEEGDGLPQFLCVECYAHIKKTLAFRRRSRRAHFVLREIQLVKKQVTQDDICTVDRKITNLVSSLTPVMSILIDIKPDNYLEIEREEAEKRQREIDEALREIHEEDGCEDTTEIEDQIPEDIDMEDIFKGLKEVESESDYEWPEEDLTSRNKPSIITPKKTYKVHTRERPRNICIMGLAKLKKVAEMLSISQIRYLTLEEQKQAHMIKMEAPEFKIGLYKCSICVTVYDSLLKLQEHVKVHQERVSFEHLCQICNDRFKYEDLLEQHSAEVHWYEYSCGLCSEKHYSVRDLVKCIDKRSVELKMETVLPLKLVKSEFNLIPATQKDMEKYGNDRYWTTPIGKSIQDIQYLCLQCKIGFSCLNSFEKHNELHKPANGKDSPKKLLTCGICNITVEKRRLLIKHMNDWHRFFYRCTKCTGYPLFLNRQQATDHFFSKHNVLKKKLELIKTTFIKKRWNINKQKPRCTLYCNSCTFKTKCGPQKYFQHILKTHGYLKLNTVREINDEQLHCSVCDIYFIDRRAFYTHVLHSKHNTKIIECICMQCFESFDTKEELQEHAKVHKKQDSGFPRYCVSCSEVFHNKIQESVHMLKRHPEEYRPADGRLCELCGKLVSCFKTHQKVHEEEESNLEFAYRCKFCEYKCRNASNYIMHILASHTHRPYLCTLCGRRMTTRCESRDHVLKIHAPVRPYTCKACDRHFSHLDYLNDHCIKIHDVDLKKTDKSVFLTPRRDNVVYVYPHLKIDGSLIEHEKLAAAKIQTCDYMDENRRDIDYTEAFFFDHTVDPNAPTKFSKKKKNKEGQRKRIRRRNQTIEQKVENKKIILNNAEVVTEKQIINDDNDVETKNTEIDNSFHENKYSDIKEDVKEIKGLDMPNITFDTDHKLETLGITLKEDDEMSLKITEDDAVIKEVVENTSDVKDEMAVDNFSEGVTNEHLEETEDVMGELIEQNGEYYVIVDGLLYKLQNN